ncbi:MAG TPA: gamma-glutamyltransferase [Methylibium sp.]|uniref:gamma-glutamyltransferase n=1 Tax=Methylibium sp. TaxID=2067992 RepID=UPI002DB734FB|nr:gamma-glutamyltransferase [Methylibium sp.]HEU4459526.1 gamma-glutamyltransferase [Methylibium sp.]
MDQDLATSTTTRPVRRTLHTTLLAAGLSLGLVAGLACANERHDFRTPGTPPGIDLPPTAETVPPAPPWDGVAYRRGVVSVSHPLAAQAGADVLARGGNAIDAAAAIQFMLNVVEPQFSGIGGGGFMMVHLANGGKSGRTFAIDGREKAPAAATPTQFVLSGVAPADRFAIASTSGLAVGVPGTLAAVDYALRRFGSIRLREAIAPAAKVAEQGFRINRFLANDIANDGGRTSFQPETAAVFRPGGVPLKEGDLLVQPDLAKAFRLIAKQGPEVFYRGEIAAAIVAAQQRSRTPAPAEGAGRMTLADLRDYRVALREPTRFDYRGYTLAMMSLPSSGGLTVGGMLGMLERFPIGDASQGFGFGSTTTLHLMAEAMRLAFADRAVWMGDADFVPVPERGLLNRDYLALRSAMISPTSRMSTPAAGNPLPYDDAMQGDKRTRFAPELKEEVRPSHTTHFSVVDRWGNVVSFTTTIESTWGTGITVPGYGFLLNNELTDFNFDPAKNAATGNPGANDVAPGKRPRSSMTPTIVFKRREPILAYGSPGGATIINSVFNVTLNLIDHRMSIQQAIDAPRLSVTSALGTVSCEGVLPFQQPKFTVATQDGLRALGHLLPGAAGTNGCTAQIGSVQGIVVDLRSGRQYGGADRRREGTVIGFGARKPRGDGHDADGGGENDDDGDDDKRDGGKRGGD